MSIEEKIKNAKPTTWVVDGIPKWKVLVWVLSAKIRARRYKLWH